MRILLDNASPHAAARTGATPEHLSWVLFDHPSSGPDLAHSNCHLKNWVRLQRFSSNQYLMEDVKAWLS
jgi:hypothetical protein